MHRTTFQITAAAQRATSQAIKLTSKSSPWCYIQSTHYFSTHPDIRPGQKISINPTAQPTRRSRKQKQTKPSGPLPFIDRIHIRAKAGNGGKGCISYHRIGSYKKRPSGGHGGKGGNVYLVTDPMASTLKMEKHHFNAPDGGKGGTNGKAGKDGRDVFVRVPVGVVVRRVLDWEEMELFDVDDDHGVDVEEVGPLLGHDLNDAEELDELDALEAEEDTSAESQDVSNELDIVTSDESFEDLSDVEEEVEMEEDFEDFDTYYEKLQASKRNQGRGKKIHDKLPNDYDDVVNQEVRGEDGMYHWASPETFTGLDDELSDTAYSRQAMDRKSIFVADLDKPNTQLLIAKGGKAGVGNQAYANRMHTPHLATHAANKAQPGDGEITHLELELKLIADVGLVVSVICVPVII